MCHVLRVCRSGYYHWLHALPSSRALENEKITAVIKAAFIENRHVYGTRRIKKALAKEGFIVSRRRIGRIMKKENLCYKIRKKFKVTTDSKHNVPIAPNLLNREFSVAKPNKYYVGDITYIWREEGWLYLAVVIDLFSRQVVGWSMNKNMKASLVNDALLMAVFKRKPGKGLIWHTDRGSQYASHSHRALLKSHGIVQSMSRKGDCWDNAVSESFFHTLKVEFVHRQKFETRSEAKTAIFEYIEVFYNRVRMHSANDYLSPVEFEKAQNF